MVNDEALVADGGENVAVELPNPFGETRDETGEFQLRPLDRAKLREARQRQQSGFLDDFIGLDAKLARHEGAE